MGTTEDAAPDPLADPRVFQALQDYQNELDSGHRPDHAEFVSHYPDVAEALAGCLRGFDFLWAAAPRVTHGPSVAPASALATESRLGDFRILREVGRGGMGVVYEAEQLSLGRRVALKVVSAPALDDRARRRFGNEAHAAASLHHPHIVPVYAVGADGDSLFLAMQFVEGRSLAALVRQLQHPAGPSAETAANTAAETGPHTPSPESPAEQEPLSFPAPPAGGYYRAAARLAADAADALQHAHDSGIVHRDVKPGNLLVEPHGHLWVADFGLARLPGSGDLTRTGEMLGTLRYMSPEQAAGAAVDHRTDVYSLGATLYELLALRPAFPGTDPHDVLRRVASEEPPTPRGLAPAVSHDLETVVLKAMAKEPSERYATASEFADDLRRFLEDRPVLARRPTLPHRLRKWAKRNRGLVAAGLAVVVLFLASAAVALAVSADRVRAEREQTEKANDGLTRTVAERDGAIGELGKTVAERDESNTRLRGAVTDLTVAVGREERAAYLFRFLMAEREWRGGRPFEARAVLDACPPHLRRWEWVYLNHLCQPGESRVLRGEEAIIGAAFRPDGKVLATTESGGKIALWDTATWQVDRRLACGVDRPRKLVFSPDGKQLVVGDFAQVPPQPTDTLNQYVAHVRLLDLDTGTERVIVDGVRAGSLSLAVAPAGPHLVVATGTPAVQFWKLKTGQRQFEINMLGEINHVAVDGRGLTLAAYDQNKQEIQLWDLPRRTRQGAIPGLGRDVEALELSPDGKWLLATTAGATVRVCDVPAKAVRYSYPVEDPPYRLPRPGMLTAPSAIHPGGEIAAVSRAEDGFVRTWGLNSRAEVHRISELVRGPSRLEFSPDGRLLCVLKEDGSVAVVRSDPPSIPESRTFKPAAYTTPSPDAHWTFTRKTPQGAFVVRVRSTGAEVLRVQLPPDRQTAGGRFTHDGRFLVATDYELTRGGEAVKPWLSVWDLHTGRAVLDRTPRQDRECHAAVSLDGKRIALFHPDREGLVVSETDTGRAVTANPIRGTFGRGMALDATGSRVAIPYSDSTLRVYDARTGELVATCRGHQKGIYGVAFEPSGNRVATAGDDATVRVWDATTGRQVCLFDQHIARVQTCAWSPDGKRIASGGLDQRVYVWDSETGQALLSLGPTDKAIGTLVFSRDGRRLAATLASHRVVVWGPDD